MRKVFLSIVGFSLLCKLNVSAQTKQDSLPKNSGISLFKPVGEPEPSEYNPRALHIDEINLVSSYYWQNGDHSPVTGGIGTEKVTDISNGLDLKMVWGDPKVKQNSLTLGLGIDHHTSASAAYVNFALL